MSYRVRVVQRVGIDVDDEHGDHPGDGAALVELAVLQLDLELPFAPFPTLVIRRGGADVELDEVVWDDASQTFVCNADVVWMQTRAGVEGIVENLIAGGFRPLEPDHRNEEVH